MSEPQHPLPSPAESQQKTDMDATTATNGNDSALRTELIAVQQKLNGLNGNFKQVSEKLSKAEYEVSQLRSQLQERESHLEARSSEIKGHLSSQERLNAELAEARRTLSQLQVDSELSTALTTQKYQPLIALKEKGIIRPFGDDGTRLTGENLQQYLDNLLPLATSSSSTAPAIERAAPSNVTGSRPPIGGKPPASDSLGSLYETAIQASGTAEFDAKWALYLTALNSKK